MSLHFPISEKSSKKGWDKFDDLLEKHGYPTISWADSMNESLLNIMSALHDEVMSWKPAFVDKEKYRVGEGNGRQDISSDT